MSIHFGSSDVPITRSPDVPISSLLLTLHRHGPQSIVSLWHHHKSQSLQAILAEIATLHEGGFVEHTPSHLIPGRYQVSQGLVTFWQLTEKSKEHIAALEAAASAAPNAQEVCLGS
jgi:hypothetical protein